MRNYKDSISAPGCFLGKVVRHVRICRASVKLTWFISLWKVVTSSNTGRCLGRLRGSIFPAQSSYFLLLPHGFIAQVSEVDCGRTGMVSARRLFKTVLRSDALGPFQVAYVNFRYLWIKITNVRLAGQCVINSL